MYHPLMLEVETAGGVEKKKDKEYSMNKFLSFEKSIGAAVFRREDEVVKYLLLHYPGGHWDFPKGHIEKNETDEETLRREVREETGVDDLKIVPGFSVQEKYFYIAKGEEKEKRIKSGTGFWIFKKVAYYLAETKETKIVLSPEHQDFIWLEFDQAIEKITYGNSKRIFKKVERFLKHCVSSSYSIL